MSFNISTMVLYVSFLTGIVVCYYTLEQQSKLPETCTLKVQLSLNIILMLSVMLILLPLMQIYCQYICKCEDTNLAYNGVIVIILMSLIVIGINILSSLQQPGCNVGSVKSYIKGIIISNTVLIIIIASMVGYTKYVGNLSISIPSLPLFSGNKNIKTIGENWEDSDTF